MKQVFTNLIQNALHATKEEEKIELMVSSQPDCYEIEIKDFGKGISAENLNQVFEPYFTTRRKGTGLGLAVVRQIIENHRGVIAIASKEKIGTTVKVTLPNSMKENED
jgi:two-component system NtrC family sensor kinase